MSELALLKEFRAGAPTHPAIRVGPGSDCAVLTCTPGHEFTYKIDQVVEGTHFVLAGEAPSGPIPHATPRQVGAKALNKALSDLAAAGSWPVAAMVSVNVRKGTPDAVARELYQGLVASCVAFGCGLAGGDYAVSENGLSVSVALIGSCPAGSAWTRAGGRPGDVLLVTGSLGGSLAGKHLDFTPRLAEARAIRALAGAGVHACIDITDGLARDLKHLCDESHCGATVHAARVPLSDAAVATGDGLGHALCDGEDFELLLAVEPAAAARLLAESPRPLTAIGTLDEPGTGRWLVLPDGERRALPDVGYEHR
jgi:thiamine-monophosphate kinase